MRYFFVGQLQTTRFKCLTKTQIFNLGCSNESDTPCLTVSLHTAQGCCFYARSYWSLSRRVRFLCEPPEPHRKQSCSPNQFTTLPTSNSSIVPRGSQFAPNLCETLAINKRLLASWYHHPIPVRNPCFRFPEAETVRPTYSECLLRT